MPLPLLTAPRARARLAALVLALAGATALPTPAHARTAEAGEWNLTGQVGPGIKVGPLLGGASAFGILAGQAEYVLSPALGVVADLGLGLARTVPLRLHAGMRLRLPPGPLPLTPFVQAGVGAGGLFNVLGARLGYVSGRVGIGADYALTRAWAAGLLVAADLGTTLGQRPALWGSVDVLLGATYIL